jgi:CheY-like chemotaxis protein
VFILVADDEEDIRDLMCTYLEHLGHTVAAARDGAEALDVARAGLPDVILMDLSMPNVDGLTAARAIRGLPGATDISILAVSGFVSDPLWCRRAKAAGCCECLPKPVDFGVLASSLERAARGASPRYP